MKGKALRKGLHDSSLSKDPKFEKVMHEGKEGTLHSGSKHGPLVRNRAQMIAIAFSEAEKHRRKKK